MSTTQITFRDLIAANKRNSIWLVAIFVLFTVAVAVLLSLAIVAVVDPTRLETANWSEAVLIGGIAAVLSLLFSIVGFYAGDSLVLGVSHAQAIGHDDDPVLFNVVEEMAIAAGVPVPRIYVIDDSAPNAFATGRDPEHASLAVTRGLRAKLERDELQGVIAHEMSHVRNYDIRLMLLMSVLVGTIAMLSDLALQAVRFAPMGRRNRDRGQGSDSNVIALVLIVVGLLLAIVAPVLAQIIQLAVSREREYLADASAVELTRHPQGLAGALRKIDEDTEVLEAANRGTAHLYIANPIKKFEERSGSVFASHPPIKERIRRIEELLA